MVENLLKVFHVLEGLRQAEHLTMLSVQATINKDQRLTVRELEADLGIPETTVLRFWCGILVWNVSGQNLFCSFCYQSRRNIMLQLPMTWFEPLPVNQISSRSWCWDTHVRSQGAYFEGDLGVIVLWTMFLISSSISVSICHSSGWMLSGQASVFWNPTLGTRTISKIWAKECVLIFLLCLSWTD